MKRRAHAHRLPASLAISAVFVLATIAMAWAQGQPPAGTQGRGRGIQPLEHPILPIGSPAPDFSLPGIDGKVHKLDVKVTRPGMTVRARRSYLAAPDKPSN